MRRRDVGHLSHLPVAAAVGEWPGAGKTGRDHRYLPSSYADPTPHAIDVTAKQDRNLFYDLLYEFVKYVEEHILRYRCKISLLWLRFVLLWQILCGKIGRK